AEHRICAAGGADVGGVVADLGPLDAADGTQLQGLGFALGADLVGRQGRILSIFSGRDIGAAAGTVGGRGLGGGDWGGGSERGGQFLGEKVENTLGEMFRGEAKVLYEFPGIAGYAEAIGNTDHGELQRKSKILALLENGSGHDIAEAADLVFFGGDHDAGFFRGAHQGGDIQRLDGMNVHHARFDGVLLFQEPGGAHRFGNHGAAGDDGDVLVFVVVGRTEESLKGVEEFGLHAAVANDVGDAEFIRCVGFGDDGRGFAGEAQVAGALQLE